MKLSEHTRNKIKLKVIENPVKIFTSSVFIFDFSEGRVNLPCPGHDRVKVKMRGFGLPNLYDKAFCRYEISVCCSIPVSDLISKRPKIGYFRQQNC